MLARPENPKSLPEKPAPAEAKRRTITLTNRAPIRIVEDNWPIVAEGHTGEEWVSNEYFWDISIYVRREKDRELHKGLIKRGRTLIHAKYENFDVDKPEQSERVRLGRLIDDETALTDLWGQMLAVGEELRERIESEVLRRQVTHALDRCFADLPAQET